MLFHRFRGGLKGGRLSTLLSHVVPRHAIREEERRCAAESCHRTPESDGGASRLRGILAQETVDEPRVHRLRPALKRPCHGPLLQSTDSVSALTLPYTSARTATKLHDSLRPHGQISSRLPFVAPHQNLSTLPWVANDKRPFRRSRLRDFGLIYSRTKIPEILTAPMWTTRSAL